MSPRSPLRSLYWLFASLLIIAAGATSGLACAPKAEESDSPPPSVARPPAAEVVARLTDIGPVGPDDRAGKPSLAEPQLLEVGPTGTASSSAAVTLRFSEPMDPEGPVPHVVLDPPVDGQLRWTDPYRLSFVAHVPFRGAHGYAVTASGVVRSRAGATASVEAKWSFETPRPTVEIWEESSGGDGLEPDPVHWRNRFNVSTSHDVGATALRRATEVFDVSGREPRRLEFRLEGDFRHRTHRTTRNWEIVPRGHWPADALIEARVTDALVTTAGPLPTGETVTRRLRTRPGVAAVVECEDQLPEGCPPGYLTIDFDAPVSRAYLRNIRVSPKPAGLSISHGYGERKNMDYVFISGDFVPGTTYSVRIKKGLKDIHGQPYAGPAVQKITTVRPPPLLALNGDGVLLASSKGTVGVESRLVEEASLSISTLDDAALVELVALQHDARYRPRHGARTQHETLDLVPGGTYGWDAREIDLEQRLGAPHFAAFVEVEPTVMAPAAKLRAPVGSSQVLIQRTDLGAVFGRSPARSFVRVARLRSAAPLADARVTVFDVGTTPPTETGTFGPTDKDGFVLLPPHASLPKTAALVIRHDDDRFAMLVPDQGWYQRGSHGRGEDYDVGVLMPDRNLYQPGERMRVMGWVAKSVANGGAGLASPGARPVKVRLEDGNKVLAEATVRAKPYGKFWATLDLPEDTPLGSMSVRATLGSEGGRTTDFSAYVRVREFEAPAFDVKLSVPDADLPHNSVVTVSARAAYLHGMSLPVARARLNTECGSRTYRPPGPAEHDVLEPTRAAEAWGERTTVPTTDDHKRGVVETRVDLTPLEDGRTYRCNLSLGIQDAARQEISTDTKVWVHPSHYLMISRLPASSFVQGTAATWDGVSVLYDGTPGPSDRAKIEIEALKYDAEHHFVSSKVVKTCAVEIDGDNGGRCSWTPPRAGRYRATIKATVDAVERSRTEEFRVFAPPVRRSRPERFSFSVQTPSKVKPGDEVAVKIQSQEEVSSGFVVDVHAGVRSLHAFDTRDHAAAVMLQADDAWVPRTYLDTFVTRPAGPTGLLPRVFRTSNRITMGLDHRNLAVEIANPSEASIRSALPIEVRVADTEGRAVADAHVSVWAVDEGVLMLRDWTFPDFPEALSTDRGNEATYFEDYDALRRPYTKRPDPYEPRFGYGSGGGSGSGYGRGSGSGFGGRGKKAPRMRAKVRRNFDPAPIFVGDVVTNAAGVATLEGTLPDNLTTFRIAAVATAEVGDTGAFARAGRTEGRVRVTQDLGVRALLPNVLRPGDTAQLAALVDNIAGLRGDLDVTLEIDDPAGALELQSNATVKRAQTDAPQERIPFTVLARKPGTVRIRVHATLDGADRTLQDASELSLDIVPERTLQHRSATYGSFDEATPRAIELAPPADAHSFTASVDLYTSLLGGYAGNVDALVDYPYGCVEQTSSQLIPLIALHGVRDYPLGIEDPTKFVDAGVRRLSDMQLQSGAFGYWPGATTPHVYGTAYATWVLGRALKAGYDIPPYVLDRATAFLEEELGSYSARGTPTVHQEIRAAMALHALAEAGRSAPTVRDALIDRAASLPAFARALLLMALHRELPDDPRVQSLLGSLTASIEERDSIARTRADPTRYTRYFDSPTRTDAIVLLALTQVQPTSPLVEKLARGLAGARDAGSIRNTQENAYALLAMAAYAAQRESTPPALDVHTWLDNDPLLDVRFDGRDLSVHRAKTPFAAGKTPRVTLDPQGEGRLYYRIAMGWTKAAAKTKAHASGLAVSRRLHDEGGNYGPGRPMKAGDTAWLEVQVTADMRQRYVALDIPIPAGLEAVDTTLGRTGPVLVSGGTSKGARSLGYNHRELRRDRVILFVDHLDSGDHRLSVPVRATHEGTYSFPPARAEGMYSPEVYGHSAGTTLEVVPPTR